MNFSKIKLFYNTLRYLRLRQLYFQLIRRINKLKHVNFKGLLKRGNFGQINWPAYLKPATQDGVNFDFLNQSGTLCDGWNSSQYSKLWLYNLHYLDVLNSTEKHGYPELKKVLIQRWIEENPPCKGNGWEPYPLSLRLVNLVKWCSTQDDVPIDWVRNIGLQTEALYRQCEYNILGNHLFANGKALTFAGCYLNGEVTHRWLKKGLAILDREVAEQFLDDGGHFELSPMYHALLLWDMCDLYLLSKISDNPALIKRMEQWRKVILKGVEWLRLMVHPDQQLSFFNDSSFGIAPTLDQIEAYCRELDCLPTFVHGYSEMEWYARHLENSGYVSVSLHSCQHRALLDVAKIGSDYQPGHAHADTLSFELSLFGQRLFVNSGTSQYGTGLQRELERGTSAHNTVMVDGVDSSEVWAGFRVARRARPYGIEILKKRDKLSVCAGHDGYRRLKKEVLVERTWTFAQEEMTIHDHLVGHYSLAVSRFYCHPDVKVTKIDNELRLVMSHGQSLLMQFEGAIRIGLINSNWYPGFNISLPNTCIEVVFDTHDLKTYLKWSGR